MLSELGMDVKLNSKTYLLEFRCLGRRALLKRVSHFPVPSRDVTDQTLSGREKTKLFPPRKSLISDIPAGDGKTANSFLQCGCAWFQHFCEFCSVFSRTEFHGWNLWDRLSLKTVNCWNAFYRVYSKLLFIKKSATILYSTAIPLPDQQSLYLIDASRPKLQELLWQAVPINARTVLHSMWSLD